MPLDAICLSAVREELSRRITGMKIEKIQQPERDVVILSLRGAGEPCRLLMSAGSGDARVHLTEHQFENPSAPPMFCMLLRKHLTGARIISVAQLPAERALILNLQASDAMGTASEKRLIIEMIGRTSNIILTDDERIIDCLRRIGGELSDKRAILPGMLYRAPPPQEGKVDPYDVNQEMWRDLFRFAAGKTADKWLLSAFSALSPLICRELSWRAYGDAECRVDGVIDGGKALSREFFALMDAARLAEFEPWSVVDGEGISRDFSYIEIMQYENALKRFRNISFSAMLDSHFTLAAQRTRVNQRASAMLKMITTARERVSRKLAIQREEMKKAAGRDELRVCGDLITANIHLIGKGQTELITEDYYSENGSMRSIALDAKKNPQQNAARYYKEYAKAKSAEKYLAEQITYGENELAYLESVIDEIGRAEGERDLNEIRGELEQTGYCKGVERSKTRQAPAAPMRFLSSSGLEITVGKNNAQNDALTLKTALKSDVWLHAQKVTGSHVIIACGGSQPDTRSLSEAAAIAAFYSSARSSGKAAVDYAFVKHVKKPPGARPGMVIYSNYKTIFASPDEELVNRLRRQ